MVSVGAAVKGFPAIAVGNVIGSNICNILLVLGLAALLRPITVPPHSLYRDGSILLGATLLVLVMLGFGSIQRWEGAILLLLLLGFTAFAYGVERRAAATDPQRRMHVREALEVAPLPLKPWVTLLLLACGIVILAVGSNQLINGATALARAAVPAEMPKRRRDAGSAAGWRSQIRDRSAMRRSRTSKGRSQEWLRYLRP